MSVPYSTYIRNRDILEPFNRFVVHGPMWQAECNWCHWIGDAVDTEAEALTQRDNHKCTYSIEVEA